MRHLKLPKCKLGHGFRGALHEAVAGREGFAVGPSALGNPGSPDGASSRRHSAVKVFGQGLVASRPGQVLDKQRRGLDLLLTGSSQQVGVDNRLLLAFASLLVCLLQEYNARSRYLPSWSSPTSENR